MRTFVASVVVLLWAAVAQAQVPGAPTSVTARPFNGALLVSFTPPADVGGSAITSFAVTVSPSTGGAPVTRSSSPILVLVTNGTAYTATVTATNSHGTGPASASSAPVTPVAVTAPPDAPVTLTLGSVTIATHNPVTITPLENSTNLFFVATNTGASAATLEFTSWDEIARTAPSWIGQAFKLFGNESGGNGQPSIIPLAPGETRTLSVYLGANLNCAGDCLGGAPQQALLSFRFRVGAAEGTLPISIDASDLGLEFYTVRSAVVTGTVTATDGTPLPGALVTMANFTNKGLTTTIGSNRPNKNTFQTTTAADGTYRLDVISMNDIRTMLGSRRLPYRSLDYFITVEADGYGMVYEGEIAPTTGQTLQKNVVLTRQAQRVSYRMQVELATNGHLSYWWIRFAGPARDRVVAVQGQHPPVDPATPNTHIIAVSLTGQELWRIPTGAQCDGLDVSPDGRMIAAGCDDRFVYLISDDGVLRHKISVGDRPGGGFVADVRFSPDGTRLIADGGGGGGFSVLDVQTGTVLWRSTDTMVLGVSSVATSGSRWSPDGSRLVAGSNGPLAAFTRDGQRLWQANIGESPLWIEVDAAHNVYAGGKSRELFAFDAQGNLRWSYRLMNTPNEAWRGITLDGSLMVMPGFDGSIQALRADGTAAWQRMLPVTQNTSATGPPQPILYGTGHNALSMTPSGSLIAVGTRGNQVVVYDRAGTQVWSHAGAERTDFLGPAPVTHGNYTGTQSLEMSPDGKYIAAGYADSVIRIFARQSEVVTAPSTLRFAATKAGADGALQAMTGSQTVTVTFPTASDAAVTSPAWTVTVDQPWVQLSSTSGAGAGVFSVSIVNPGNVIAGQTSLTATITITSTDAANAPLSVPVTLTVSHPGTTTTSAPIGQVDTPAQNATGVQGAIAMTGWVVDDVGIQHVRIYRQCLSFESAAAPAPVTAPCQDVLGQRVVFVGEASLIAGARPDVEAQYPTLPAANSAGWGFLILSNLLPNIPASNASGGGVGTFHLYAVATDQEGNQRLLGRTVNDAMPTAVTVANDTIAKPFGAIDTPMQGATVSGTLNNFGWALTPDSNTVADATDILVPTTGNTVNVIIDGALVGTASYNLCRGPIAVGGVTPAGQLCDDDVSSIFRPGGRYRNLDAGRGPIALRTISTSTLTNGLHTIQWGVTDSASRGEGIGSRYFNVLNSAAAARSAGALEQSRHACSTEHCAPSENFPVADFVIYGRTGFNEHRAFVPVESVARVPTIVVPEMGRVELQVPGALHVVLVANGEMRDAPVGVSVDADAGMVRWSVGPGYLGTYRLSVERTDDRVLVDVVVAPMALVDEPVKMHLDVVRVDGPVLSERSVRVEGWALDPQADTGSGIGAVHVWARNKASGADAFFLGTADLGIARPDVASAHGARFTQAGFRFTSALGEGEWEITAYIWNVRTQRFEDARSVRVMR